MTEAQIIAVLRRYRVQRQYKASTEARAVRYAVFTGVGEQLKRAAIPRRRQRRAGPADRAGYHRSGWLGGWPWLTTRSAPRSSTAQTPIAPPVAVSAVIRRP